MTKTTTNITNAASGHAYAADIVSGRYHAENKVGFGDESEFVYASQSTPFPVDDPDLLIARELPGTIPVHASGYIADVDTGSTPEDLWSGDGLWADTLPTAAQTYNVVSANAADAAAGTGMRTVTVYGLDSSWDLASETVTLNGTTNVPTVGTFWRLFSAVGQTWGTGRVNAGLITATGTTDSNVILEVEASGPNRSRAAVYTVPTGYTAYVEDYWASLGSGAAAADRAEVSICTRDATATLTLAGWIEEHRAVVSSESAGRPITFRRPLKVTEQRDIVLRVPSVSADNSELFGGFNLTLVPDA